MKLVRKILTLAMVRNSGRILLGLKKRGFGEGKWNGFGGKVEPGESIHEAAIRELHEESGIRADDLKEVGLLEFEFIGDPTLLEVHVFTTRNYTGEPTESEEMKPQWYDVDSIPFEKMWADDKLWFPMLLQGHKFHGYFVLQGHEKIISHKLHEVKEVNHICDWETR